MDLKETIRRLYCLNEQGKVRANEVLKDLMQNQENIKISYEQLTQEIKEEENYEYEYSEGYEREHRSQLEEKYKKELRLLSMQVPSFDNIELLEAIQCRFDAGKLGVISLFNYGVFEGKRAERARRKVRA